MNCRFLQFVALFRFFWRELSCQNVQSFSKFSKYSKTTEVIKLPITHQCKNFRLNVLPINWRSSRIFQRSYWTSHPRPSFSSSSRTCSRNWRTQRCTLFISAGDESSPATSLYNLEIVTYRFPVVFRMLVLLLFSQLGFKLCLRMTCPERRSCLVRCFYEESLCIWKTKKTSFVFSVSSWHVAYNDNTTFRRQSY